MGKDLHYSIKPFIERALQNHSAVASLEWSENEEYFFLTIKRKNTMSDVVVVLSDDYHFGDFSTIAAQEQLKNGGFILIARPEAFDSDNEHSSLKISVGKIGKLMGAINRPDFWTYKTKSDRH